MTTGLKNTYLREGSKLTMVGAALLVTLVGGFEGLRQVAYLDPVGIPTACFGYTDGVRVGDRYTLAQCHELLLEELLEAETHVNRCIAVDLTDTERAALVSFTYNVGPSGVCGSTLQRYFNAGMKTEGCLQLDRWVYAKGVKLPGLVTRRAAERDLCLSR